MIASFRECGIGLLAAMLQSEAWTQPQLHLAQPACPMGSLPEGAPKRKATIVKNHLLFLLKVIAHAVIGTAGVPTLTAVLTFPAVRIARHFVAWTTPKLPNVLLTEVPGFPLQVVIGLALGYLVWRLAKQRAAFWAWVPSVAILLAMILRSASSAEGGSGVLQLPIVAFEHFFGAGCRLVQHCFDQVIYALPTVAAISYSLGAFVASRRSGTHRYIRGNPVPPEMEIGL